MKITLEKSVTDLENYPEDISDAWIEFLEEVHEHGKEKALNKYAEKCFPDGVTISEFNEWLRDEEDLIRDSIDLPAFDYMSENEDMFDEVEENDYD